MEVKATRRIRLVPHQDSGRVRWCVGHERKWQTWLKWMVFIPAILLPIVVVLIFVVRSNSSFPNEVSTSNVSRETNLSLADHMGQRQKRDERFSSLFKRCYKLYLKLHPDRESFLDSENNRGRKLNYLDENPSNFERNFPVYFGENQDKHRTLEICLKNFGDQFQRRKRHKRNEVRFWTQNLDINDVRIGQAETMKTFMNLNVDPCDNFYEYACGNWEKHFEVPPDKAVFGTFEMVRDNLNLKLKELLESDYYETLNMSTQFKPNLKDFIEDEYNGMDDSDAISKAKKFYKSCMKQDIIEKRGEKPLQKLLEELGGWPILNSNWQLDNFNLVWIMSKLRLLNNDILISQWIGPDIQNSKEHIIHIDQTSLGLPNRAYFLDATNQKSLKAYKTFILTVAVLLGAQSNVARKDVEDIVKFETKLASILSPQENRQNIRGIYERMTIKTFMERYHSFEWLDYFRTILGKDIDLNSTVACYCARYIDQLLILLNNTNPRTIQNYLLWRFIRHRTPNLDSRFMDSEQKFYRSLLGRENQPPRWKFCVSQTNINMGMALGALFIKNYFDENSRKDTIKVTEAIMQAFIDTLKSKDWLNEDTKMKAVMKIENMDLKVGFPDFLLNTTKLDLKYSNVRIDENYYFENVLSVLRHASKEDQKKVGLLVDKLTWNTAPAVVNAYYSRNKNQIMLPAGILQPPIYHKYFPKSLNFGGIGVVIGHEITHAFDDKGRLFNHNGNLEMWWNSEAIEKFYYKSQCIIDQYGKYTLSGSLTPLNGSLTKGENIADNGGLKQAYKAYENWLNKNPGVDETLPNLNLTGPQLFFLNFAQVWCGKYRMEAVKNQLKTSVHSPGRFRVIGTLSNSPEFSKIFNCPKGSPMNPPQKCDLW